jgi:hypothetical protein
LDLQINNGDKQKIIPALRREIEPCTLNNIPSKKEKIEGIPSERMVAQRRYISSLPPFVSG